MSKKMERIGKRESEKSFRIDDLLFHKTTTADEGNDEPIALTCKKRSPSPASSEEIEHCNKADETPSSSASESGDSRTGRRSVTPTYIGPKLLPYPSYIPPFSHNGPSYPRYLGLASPNHGDGGGGFPSYENLSRPLGYHSLPFMTPYGPSIATQIFATQGERGGGSDNHLSQSTPNSQPYSMDLHSAYAWFNNHNHHPFTPLPPPYLLNPRACENNYPAATVLAKMACKSPHFPHSFMKD